jgi:hypothetical protein
VAWPGLAASRPTLREPAGAGTRAHGVITAAMAATVARPPLASPGAIGGEVMPCSFGRERRLGGAAHFERKMGRHGGSLESDDGFGLGLKSGERSLPVLGVRAVTHCGRRREARGVV